MATKYTISRKHVFVDNEPVLMYYVENIPFAFDTLEKEEKEDKWRDPSINEIKTGIKKQERVQLLLTSGLEPDSDDFQEAYEGKC